MNQAPTKTRGSVRNRVTALKLRLDTVVGRYYSLRGSVYGALGSRGDPDKRDRFGDPRHDMLTLEGWLNDICDALEAAKPERGDEIHVSVRRKGPEYREGRPDV